MRSIIVIMAFPVMQIQADNDEDNSDENNINCNEYLVDQCVVARLTMVLFRGGGGIKDGE